MFCGRGRVYGSHACCLVVVVVVVRMVSIPVS